MEETRYWPRLGMRVTKRTALEAAERMGGQASFFDDEMEEFVMTDNLPSDAKSEVERLFESPNTTDKFADDSHTVILESLTLHRQRKKKIMRFRKELKTFELEGKVEMLAEYVDAGKTEIEAQRMYEVELKREKDALVATKYNEWFDGEVIKIQKKYGVYKEQTVIDVDEEEE